MGRRTVIFTTLAALFATGLYFKTRDSSDSAPLSQVTMKFEPISDAGKTVFPTDYASRLVQNSGNLIDGRSPSELAEALLLRSAPKEYKKHERILRYSFYDLSPESSIAASDNGFVRTAMLAYAGHHHLIIRPEDVWFAILTQLSFYINGHAEALRSHFVDHEGKKRLKVVDIGTIDSADFGKMAIWITEEIQANVKDPELRQWIMPDFSSTTKTDSIVAAILMMGSMQSYFEYTFQLLCGIPSVTLLGEREDWVKLLKRLRKLPELGQETTQWYAVLSPILSYFVRSWDEPDHPDVRDFWNRIASKESMGSGPDYLTGWMTAFCFWDVDGKPLSYRHGLPTPDDIQFSDNPNYDLGSALKLRVDMDKVPTGYVTVPVKVDDNGRLYNTEMLAGSVGMRIMSSGQKLDESYQHVEDSYQRLEAYEDSTPRPLELGEPTGEPGLDTVTPLTGWWMYELKDEKS
ncbi:MAG: hypothetical protein M1820_001394 [Bogoriella megaspora]|nr:MAG: hypothetical protein M1820_001394 [Bogoriella megaspora]